MQVKGSHTKNLFGRSISSWFWDNCHQSHIKTCCGYPTKVPQYFLLQFVYTLCMFALIPKCKTMICLNAKTANTFWIPFNSRTLLRSYLYWYSSKMTAENLRQPVVVGKRTPSHMRTAITQATLHILSEAAQELWYSTYLLKTFPSLYNRTANILARLQIHTILCIFTVCIGKIMFSRSVSYQTYYMNYHLSDLQLREVCHSSK